MSISSLQELALDYHISGTEYGLAAAHFCDGGIKLMQDPRMMNLKTHHSNLKDLVIEICYQGSSVQKLAVADSFDFKTLLCMPEIKNSKDCNEAIEWLKAQLSELALYFGASTSGDMHTLAWMLYSNYGGLSVLDFIKFFAMCKKREFVSEYEYVKTQGINADFIIKWLDKYCDKREVAAKEIESELATIKSHIDANERANETKIEKILIDNRDRYWSPEFNERTNKMKWLEAKAIELRKEFKKTMYEKTTLPYQITEGVITNIPSDCMTEKKALLYLYDFVFNFMAFDDEMAKNIIKSLGQKMIEDFESSDKDSLSYFTNQGIGIGEYKRQMAIQFVNKGQRIIKETHAAGILQKGIKEAKDLGKDIFRILGCSVEVSSSDLAKMICRGFEKTYYDYLKASIDENVAPLELREYTIQQVLILMKKTGMNRPFMEYDPF